MVRWFLVIFFLIPAISLWPAESGMATEGPAVTVLGIPFFLQEEKKNPTQYLAEYLPQGENFQNYSKMFAVWGRLDGSDASAQVNAKVQFVKARQGKDPMANYNLFQSNDKKMYGLDFLISEGGVLEHNIWTFHNVKGGVLAYQYVRRYYEGKSSGSESEFIKAIPSIRDQVLKFFNTANLPRPQGY